MADGVARSPSRICSRDGNICCYGDALGTIFLLTFVPCFLLFVFLFVLFFLILSFSCIPVCLSSSCPFACAATICYSQQVRILQYVFFLCFVSFVPYPISELFCFLLVQYFFSYLLFLGWLFCCCCALVPCTLALDLPTLILQRLVFLCLTVCDNRICISLGRRIRKDTGGTADVVGQKERFNLKTTTTTRPCISLVIWNNCTSKHVFIMSSSFEESDASCSLIVLHLLAILPLNGRVGYIQYTSNLLSSVDE